MGMTKTEMQMMARKTDKGIGGYPGSVSYKLANSDLSVQDVVKLTGIDASSLEGWNWDDHDILMDDLGESEMHRIANLPIL